MKIRLDQYIFEEGYAPSRRRAQALIMSGIVFVNNQKADKAGTMIKDTDIVEVRGKDLKYVSRGGLKLEKAINEYGLNLTDKICMDIGASTGGFTDCMLQNGAQKVYAVDVGYGQLAWKLRCDERVVNIERTNIRHIDIDSIGEELDFISIDVSFISLKLVLPVVTKLLRNGGKCVSLIKPQFEAGREEVGKKGVVRDIKIHKKVILECMQYALDNGLSVTNLDFSPIKGPEGNIEFLMYISKDETVKSSVTDDKVDEVVNNAHSDI